MKKLLIILLMPCWCIAQQRPTAPEPAKPRRGINEKYHRQSAITFTTGNYFDYIEMRTDADDSTITIHGDTLQLIRGMFRQIWECQEKYKMYKLLYENLIEDIEYEIENIPK